MWQNVGSERFRREEEGRDDLAAIERKKRVVTSGTNGYWRVDCQSASKGLFLGLLCLVAGIIILIIFFVMKVSYN